MKHSPTPVQKVVHYIADDNSVEMYTLIRSDIVETYLRRGGSVELVTGDVDLNWEPESPPTYMDLKRPDTGSWSQSGGFKIRNLPKLR